jgi:hypothetical protein
MAPFNDFEKAPEKQQAVVDILLKCSFNTDFLGA